MAFHHRLSLWQKVLLGVFCFPFLPFYLCYLCCAEREGHDEEGEAKAQRDVGAMEQGTMEQRNATSGLAASRASGQKGVNKLRDSLVLHRSKVNAQVHSARETANDTSQDAQGGQVTFEMQPRSTPTFLKKLSSFGKGKPNTSVRGQDNRGFEADGKQRPQKKKPQNGKYAYPWDKSSLKSLEIDLKAFEKLDTYASKVDVNSSVDDLVRLLLQEAHTDIEKVRAIFMWVCHHIEYDTVGYHDKEARSSDPKDILKTRKGVCAGYAGLFHQMCSVAGIQCEQISGYAKGIGYNIGQRFSGDSDHAWNAVHLDGRWHLLDSTWAAGHSNADCTQFNFKYSELYFLTHPAIFFEAHFPEEKDWQLLSPPLSITQFENTIKHEQYFYSMGLLSSSPDTPVIKTVNGKVVISIEGCSPTLFTFNLNGTNRSGLMTLKKCGMMLEVYPQKTGSHQLQIYAKPFTSSAKSYSCVLEYIVECSSVDKKIKIPKLLDNPVGPSWLSETKGLLQPSHPDPIINTPDGRCSVSFTLEEDMDAFATLDTEDMAVTEEVKRRHVFKWQQENRIVFKIQLPQAGTFVLKIYARNKKDEGKSYDFVCNYLLSCANASVKWPIFPLIYTSWLEYYELVEPTAGVLPANRNVHFKLKVPGVSSVFVKDKRDCLLTLSEDGYWEGSFNTGQCRDVNVMVQETPNRNSYISILNYQVENH